MDQKQVMILAALGIGAYYLMGNMKGIPQFKNMQGQIITSIQCGNSVVFDVPGYSMVWLTRIKNGVQDFDGLYALPVPPYILNCSDDTGSYTLTAYALNPDNTKGVLIGQTNFTVIPQTT